MSAGNVGKRCRWAAYPNAGVGAHEGEIVAFVPAGEALRDARDKVSGGFVLPRVDAADVVSFDRYLVREDRGNSTRGKPYKPRWYAPRVSKVEIVDGGGT